MASTKAKFGFIKGSSIIDVAELPSPVVKSAINPTGTYDKVYFNTSLTSDEIQSIFDKITFSTISGINVYYIFTDETSQNGIAVMKGTSNGENMYTINAILNGVDNRLIYANEWDVKIDYAEINSVTGVSELQGIPVGQQNELLKDLVYVEEVDESKINTKALYRLPDGTLWHYNGQWNAVGSGSSNGIIEVDTLPTENINTEAIYKLNAKSLYLNITSMGLVGSASDLGITVYYVSSLPTENIDYSAAYFVTSENKAYLFDGEGLVDVETMIGASYKGEISDSSQATEEGYYTIPVTEYYTYGDDWFKLTMTKEDMVYHSLTNTQIKTITEIYDERVLEVIPGAFNYCENLEKIKLPNCFRIEPHAFMYCRNLKVIDILGGVIGLEAFTVNAYDRTYVIRNTEAVCNLGNPDDLGNMGILKWYVPDELVETYKANTNYASIVDKILPLSEYKED